MSAASKRLKKRKQRNRYDKFPKAFYIKAQKAFIKLAKNKNKYHIMDSSENTRDLENKILDISSCDFTPFLISVNTDLDNCSYCIFLIVSIRE